MDVTITSGYSGLIYNFPLSHVGMGYRTPSGAVLTSKWNAWYDSPNNVIVTQNASGAINFGSTGFIFNSFPEVASQRKDRVSALSNGI